MGEWVIPLRLLRLPEHLAVLKNAFTRQCQNGRRSSWEVRPYTWRKTLFVIWDVNRFADKSSCATDPICKMLHLMGQLLHFHLRPSLPGQILSKRYFIYVPILIIILPIIPKRKKLWQLSNVCLDQGWKGRVFSRGGTGRGSEGVWICRAGHKHTLHISPDWNHMLHQRKPWFALR